jgi:hypothetical protein
MGAVLNFLFVIATAFTCLWLNHVSDETRVADAQLRKAKTEIAVEGQALKVLQADWERASNPDAVRTLAVARLGFADEATVEVASLELLPRRGEAGQPAASAVTNASATATATTPSAQLHLIAVHAGE